MADVATSVVALLADLVAINSVNASMAASPGERDAADFVAAFGRRIGAETALEDVLPGRPNVRVTLPATRSLSSPPAQPAQSAQSARPVRRLLFDVHLDTVPLEPMEQALTPRIEGGKMWGRGACDTKGSLAAVLAAMERVAAQRDGRDAEIVLLGTVDEEYRKQGIEAAVAAGLTATAAVVGEPTALQPIVAHKGAVRWRITTLGKAAHTSRPENGINAIYHMVSVIEALREHLEPKLETERHPLLTPPTLTVGTIAGGIGVNIVPEVCSIDIDRRTLPSEDPDAILAEVDAVLQRLSARDAQFRVRREPPFLSERGLETPPDAPLVHAVQRACRAVRGADADVTPRGVPYGTDGTHLSGTACIPTLVFGPGDIAQAHSADEWVELSQVEQAADIYYDLMRSFLAGEW
jgi:acetylornithine deacetylase